MEKTQLTPAEQAIENITNYSETRMLFLVNRVIVEYVTELVKSRTLTITGDTTHLSIRHLIDSLGKVDEPRKYDFQKENQNELDLIHDLEHFYLPNYGCTTIDGDVPTKDQLIGMINGDHPVTFQMDHSSKCHDCGDKLLVTINGTNLHYEAENGPCQSNMTFEVEIDFPTGEVVFGDWPDRFSEMAGAGMLPNVDFDINNYKGCRQTTDAYVPYQVFHHSVGNTCPSLFYNPDTKSIRIGGTYDEDTDEMVSEAGYNRMGYFCTDLWWVTMLDKKYYDAMLAKLPPERSQEYYDKEVTTAKIEPGRYRFTAYARTEDIDLFASAVRIGECSGIPPVIDFMADRKIITPMEYCLLNARCPISKEMAKKIFIGKMDYIFNVLGNGIRTESDILKTISVSKNTQIPDFDETAVEKWPYEPSAYPNFREEYSALCRIPLDNIPSIWIQAGIDYYRWAKKYFEDGAPKYFYLPPEKGSSGYTDFETRLAKMKGDLTEKEWHDKVSKDYETDFDGDFDAFLDRRWNKERVRCIAFCQSTIDRLEEVIASR